jgi:RNA polymerase sigma factor (sigma-70 family)
MIGWKLGSTPTCENSGRAPTLRELSQALDIDLGRMAFLENIESEHFISTDEPFPGDADLTVGHTLASSDPLPSVLVANAERDELVRNTLDRLAPRDGQVLARRFGIGNSDIDETLQEIGEDLGVTRERIRQIEKKALTKIKPLLEPQDLDGIRATSGRADGTVKKANGNDNKKK